MHDCCPHAIASLQHRTKKERQQYGLASSSNKLHADTCNMKHNYGVQSETSSCPRTEPHPFLGIYNTVRNGEPGHVRKSGVSRKYSCRGTLSRELSTAEEVAHFDVHGSGTIIVTDALYAAIRHVNKNSGAVPEVQHDVVQAQIMHASSGPPLLLLARQSRAAWHSRLKPAFMALRDRQSQVSEHGDSPSPAQPEYVHGVLMFWQRQRIFRLLPVFPTRLVLYEKE